MFACCDHLGGRQATGERVVKAERRTRTKRTHPLKGVRMFACRPVVASEIEAAEALPSQMNDIN